MKSPITHFILTLVVGLGVVAGYCSLYATVSYKSSVVANVESQIIAANNTVSRTASARVALAEVSSDESQIRSYFVPQTDVVTFINSIEALGLANESLVKVLSVSTSGNSSSPTLIISMAVTGAFDAVMRTVGAIEYAPYAISVSTLSVGQDQSNSWHANLTIIIGSIAQATTTSSK